MGVQNEIETAEPGEDAIRPEQGRSPSDNEIETQAEVMNRRQEVKHKAKGNWLRPTLNRGGTTKRRARKSATIGDCAGGRRLAGEGSFYRSTRTKGGATTI